MRLNRRGYFFLSIALFFILQAFFVPAQSFSQVKKKDPLLKWSSWLLLQTIPSISFFEDRDEKNSRLKFGLEWQVIPLSVAFSSNKYVSRYSFFYLNPTKRFAGSAEVFFEPSYITGNFKYASLKKFMYKTGGRFIIPAAQRGEYLSFSIGAGYYTQTATDGRHINGVTYEAGVYSFYGMLGLKFNYNQNAISRYNFGLYLKYY